MVTWLEKKPEPGDIPNADLASLLTSNKQAFDGAVGKHFFWNESSGASAGIPRLSDGSFGPGSARAFYITQSQVSSATSRDALLAVTSNTSRLFAMTSTASVLVGSKNAVVAGAPSAATITAGCRILVQSGSSGGLTQAGSPWIINFPIAYAVAPLVLVTTAYSIATAPLSPSVAASTGSISVGVNGSGSACTVYWRSEGTVPL